MLEKDKVALRDASPYNAAITREQFLFYEVRTTAKLVCEGLGNDEIVDRIVKENLKTCGLKAAVFQEDALRFLERGGEYDLILIDPPYDSGLYEPVLERINSVDILSDGGIIICESRRETQLPEMRAPYRKRKEYHYGKVKLCLYCKEKP